MASLMQPREFIKGGENVVANYDWTDIAEGTGLVKFYGCASALSGATTIEYNLLTHQVYSAIIEETTTSSESFDFYTPYFNMPKNVRGTAYLNLAAYIDNSSSMYFEVTFYKNSGGVDTAISSTISSEVVDNERRMAFLKIPLTFTHFKKNDRIKMTLTIVERGTGGGGGGTAGTGIDPMGRDGTLLDSSTYPDLTTQMTLYIPFVIDL